MAKSFVKAIPITFFNTAAITQNYQAINPNGLPHNCFLLRIFNNSNITVLVSYDGVTDNDEIFPTTALQLDFQTNASPNGFVAQMRKGTIVYLANPTAGVGVGIVSLIGYYQES